LIDISVTTWHGWSVIYNGVIKIYQSMHHMSIDVGSGLR